MRSATAGAGARSLAPVLGFVMALAFASTAVASAPADTMPPLGPAPDYADPATWICAPANDTCTDGITPVAVAGDGTLAPADAGGAYVAADPPIDCFYVYPTISRDPGINSDLAPHDEETWVTRNQAAPLSTGCRVFAPGYRQVTLAGLAQLAGGGESDPAAREVAYADVLAAWNHYLEHDNEGRGVILVGHSQGAGLLTRLIAEEIDADVDASNLLVAAYLAGTSLQVPLDSDVGGDFQNVPLCRANDQIGCAVAWASFRATSPAPADSLFGVGGDGTEAACTNPAALAGGPAELRSYFPSNHDLTILSAPAPGTPWVDPAALDAGTYDQYDWVELPGLLRGECVSEGGFNYLAVTVNGDPDDPRADDIPGNITPQWGLHLADMNVVMGDLQALVASQGAAWLASRGP